VQIENKLVKQRQGTAAVKGISKVSWKMWLEWLSTETPKLKELPSLRGKEPEGCEYAEYKFVEVPSLLGY